MLVAQSSYLSLWYEVSVTAQEQKNSEKHDIVMPSLGVKGSAKQHPQVSILV